MKIKVVKRLVEKTNYILFSDIDTNEQKQKWLGMFFATAKA